MKKKINHRMKVVLAWKFMEVIGWVKLEPRKFVEWSGKCEGETIK